MIVSVSVKVYFLNGQTAPIIMRVDQAIVSNSNKAQVTLILKTVIMNRQAIGSSNIRHSISYHFLPLKYY